MGSQRLQLSLCLWSTRPCARSASSSRLAQISAHLLHEGLQPPCLSPSNVSAGICLCTSFCGTWHWPRSQCFRQLGAQAGLQEDSTGAQHAARAPAAGPGEPTALLAAGGHAPAPVAQPAGPPAQSSQLAADQGPSSSQQQPSQRLQPAPLQLLLSQLQDGQGLQLALALPPASGPDAPHAGPAAADPCQPEQASPVLEDGSGVHSQAGGAPGSQAAPDRPQVAAESPCSEQAQTGSASCAAPKRWQLLEPSVPEGSQDMRAPACSLSQRSSQHGTPPASPGAAAPARTQVTGSLQQARALPGMPGGCCRCRHHSLFSSLALSHPALTSCWAVGGPCLTSLPCGQSKRA